MPPYCGRRGSPVLLAFGWGTLLATTVGGCPERKKPVPSLAKLVRVPAQAATIRDAVAMTASGGTIEISPGRYPTSLRISKRVHLVGTSRQAVVLEAHGQRPVITFLPGGEGSLRNLTLRGGSDGVLGKSAGGRRPARVKLLKVRLEGQRRGISGVFSHFWAEEVVIGSATQWALSITDAENVVLREVVARNAGGTCIQIKRSSPPTRPYCLSTAEEPPSGCDVQIEGLTVENCAQGGLLVEGGFNCVVIAQSSFRHNGSFGAYLKNTGATYLSDSGSAGNRAVEGRHGDGFRVRGGLLAAERVVTAANEGAGFLVAGCNRGLARLTSTLMWCQALDLVYECGGVENFEFGEDNHCYSCEPLIAEEDCHVEGPLVPAPPPCVPAPPGEPPSPDCDPACRPCGGCGPEGCGGCEGCRVGHCPFPCRRLPKTCVGGEGQLCGTLGRCDSTPASPLTCVGGICRRAGSPGASCGRNFTCEEPRVYTCRQGRCVPRKLGGP